MLIDPSSLPANVRSNASKMSYRKTFWLNQGLVLGTILLTWGLLAGATYEQGRGRQSLVGGGTIAGMMYFVTIIVTWKSGKNEQLQQFINSANGAFQECKRLVVADSILLRLADAKIHSVESLEADGGKYVYGVAGKMTNGQEYTFGRLTNAGPYRNYACLSVPMPLPFQHMIIDAAKNNKNKDLFHLKHRLGDSRRFDLEGPFVNQFDAFAASADQARLVEYVLSPDVMQQILDVPDAIDIEFIGQTMIIVWPAPKVFRYLKNDWPALCERVISLLNGPVEVIDNRIVAYRDLPAMPDIMQLNRVGILLKLGLGLRTRLGNTITYAPILWIVGFLLSLFLLNAVFHGF